MVVDTSAILAIIFDEPERAEFALKLASARAPWVSAATLLEATVVLCRRTQAQDDSDLTNFLRAAAQSIAPFDARQYSIAREAFTRYGKGSGHATQLNLGDCFAYALAKHLDMPLLFKGNDFRRTDLRAA